MAPWREIVSPRCSILSSGPEGDRDAPGSLAPDSPSMAAHHTNGRPRRLHTGASSVRRGKAVIGIQLDLYYGQAGSYDGGVPGSHSGQPCGVNGGCHSGTGGGLDINTDVAGLFEIKWIYTEFDLTGKDSLLPFIPVLTVAR